MTKPKPSRVRQPNTVLRELVRVIRKTFALAGWASLGQEEVAFTRLIAELRRSLKPRTRRGEGR